MEAKYLASDDAEWTYTVAPANTKVSLLNIGKVQSTGHWSGKYGQHFIAWAPLIKSDRDVEAVLEFFHYQHPIDNICSSATLLAALPAKLVQALAQTFHSTANPLLSALSANVPSQCTKACDDAAPE